MQPTCFTERRHERGQTIVLVAVSIVSLLAMAALAIDVVTLYVARTEIQRAADAAALAGAKAIADSGVTTLPAGDPSCTDAVTLAQTMANAAITAVLPNNLVSGTAPTLISANFTNLSGCPSNDPEVTVTLQRTGLPTFFAHIWGTRAASTGASATAEAYNPANSGGSFTPIAPRNVKPFLVANLDPLNPPNAFINTPTGAVESGVIGETFNLTADCGNGATCAPPDNPPKVITAKHEVEYLPALVSANTSNYVCPLCGGATDFEMSIKCSDENAYQYLSCGGGATNAQWDATVIPQGGATHETEDGALCLIHATSEGAGSGQDTLDKTLWPTGPMQITAESGPQSGNKVSTSSSIVSIPIIDQTNIVGSSVTIVGYLQAFINFVADGTGGTTADDLNVTVLNVVGCGTTNNGATPIQGGNGTSPIPVRLITP